jgi:surface polysaccharide O-acyltransferase-like enzyme
MNRESSIELARILGFLMVVMIHVGAPFISFHHYAGSFNWLFGNFLDGAGRAGVAVFVIITGYCMAGREVNIRKRLISVLTPLPFFLAPTYLLYLGDGFSPGRAAFLFVREVFTCGRWFFHLWYVHVVIVLYIAAPLINKLIAGLDKAAFRRLLILLAALFSGAASVNAFIGYGLLPDNLFSSRLGVFIMYYCIGAYIKTHGAFPRVPARNKFFAFAGLALLTAFLGAWYNSRFSPLYFFVFMKDHTLEYPFGEFIGGVYDMSVITVVAAAAALFLWAASVKIKSRAINTVASAVYGAYLIHVFWLNLIQYALHFSLYADTPAYPAKCVMSVVLVCVCSLGSSLIINAFGKRGLALCKRFLSRRSAL